MQNLNQQDQNNRHTDTAQKNKTNERNQTSRQKPGMGQASGNPPMGNPNKAMGNAANKDTKNNRPQANRRMDQNEDNTGNMGSGKRQDDN